MKDENGLYFYPYPHNKRVRMYVREVGGEVCFRLWNADDPEMWEGHGWVSHAAIQEAAAIYKKTSPRGFDPNEAYDIRTAMSLIQEDKN